MIGTLNDLALFSMSDRSGSEVLATRLACERAAPNLRQASIEIVRRMSCWRNPIIIAA
jgi:hypothetical protein